MKKIYFKYSPEAIISANLDMQTIQRDLKSQFGFNSFKLEDIFSSKVLNRYISWDEQKKKDFIVKIGGRANFKSTKNFIESKLGEIKNENR
jgi:hypothetical protein